MHPLFPHWRFLGAGSLLVAFSAVGQTFVLSLFGGEWRESFGLSHEQLGLAYSAATLVSVGLLNDQACPDCREAWSTGLDAPGVKVAATLITNASTIVRLGATDAAGGGRIEVQTAGVDGFVTVHAEAVTAVVTTAQGGFDARERLCRAALSILGHGLLLQGIHAREPADTTLIQTHGRGQIVACVLQREDFRAQLEQKLSEMLDIVALVRIRHRQGSQARYRKAAAVGMSRRPTHRAEAFPASTC